MRLGYDRQPNIVKQSGRFFTQGGFGKSIGDPNKLHSFILGSVELNNGDINDKLSVGVGNEFGTVWQANENYKLALTGNVMWLSDFKNARHTNIDLSWNWVLNK